MRILRMQHTDNIQNQKPFTKRKIPSNISCLNVVEQICSSNLSEK